MKKIYIIATLAFLALSSCEKKEKTAIKTSNDATVLNDSTSVVKEIVETDSTSTKTDSSDVKLLDKISTKTTTTTTTPINSANGKYALAETKWKLVALNGNKVVSATNKEYYINLDSKSGKFEAYVGCNNFAGTFVMKSSGMLMFSKIMGTKMSCPNLGFENNFIKTISKTTTYMIEKEGKVLHFHSENKLLATFEAVK